MVGQCKMIRTKSLKAPVISEGDEEEKSSKKGGKSDEEAEPETKKAF